MGDEKFTRGKASTSPAGQNTPRTCRFTRALFRPFPLDSQTITRLVPPLLNKRIGILNAQRAVLCVWNEALFSPKRPHWLSFLLLTFCLCFFPIVICSRKCRPNSIQYLSNAWSSLLFIEHDRPDFAYEEKTFKF